jgi:adenine-specific DNA-methyltransferase
VKAVRAGAFSLKKSVGCPWFLPRSPTQARLAGRAEEMPTRLADLGYRASTGPLVWNRHKEQLRSASGHDTYPLIWAEAVRRNQFGFAYRSRAHSPYFALEAGQDHLLCEGPCVLVQRTTAKEQDRRLVACAVPPSFTAQWGKIVVENHVNVLHATGRDPVDPVALAAVLNTSTVDQVFRCLSGTVAVSASELHALPLPGRKTFGEVAKLLAKRGSLLDSEPEVEAIVARAYGVETL